MESPPPGVSPGPRAILLLLVAAPALLAACFNPPVVVGKSATSSPLLRPHLSVVVVDDQGEPPPEASVAFGTGEPMPTDSAGRAEREWTGGPLMVQARAPGYRTAWRRIEALPAGPVRMALEPVVLSGTVVDEAGAPLPGTVVRLGDAAAITGLDGSYTLRQAAPGELQVIRPAWETVTVPWSGFAPVVRVTLTPRVVRAVHVTGPTAGDAASWEAMLNIGTETEVNGLMLDLKDESGRVFYDSTVETARLAGAVHPLYDLAQVVEDARQRRLYLIGRIVTFQDPITARALPHLAIREGAGERPYRRGSQYFLDPTDEEATAYGLALAEEACRAGLDEIQFDYIRFPAGFGSSARFDGGTPSEEMRVEAIRGFLETARNILNPLGCAVAADIYGIITSTPGDGGIGQQLETLAPVVDVLSPMLYPSHYSSGWYGHAVPNNHPGPVVSGALDDGLARLDGSVILRPWLQDFYYTGSQVRAEIDAAEERGLGWMLWNAGSRFTLSALNPE